MLEYISKFKKVVSDNDLDIAVLYDIATALCLADKVWGNNDKELDILRLLNSTDVFGTKASKTCEALPRVQVKRVLNDVLIIGLKRAGKNLPEGVSLSSKASSRVESGVPYDEYYEEDVADKVIGLLGVSSVDYNTLVNTIKELSINNDKYLNFDNQKNILFDKRDLILPVDICYDLKGYVSRTMKFVSAVDFEKHLESLGIDLNDYIYFIKLYYVISSLQNIILKLEAVFRKNRPMFCTVCGDFYKFLKRIELYNLSCSGVYGLEIIADGNCMKVKIFKDYMERIFNKNSVLIESAYDEHLQAVKKFSEILIRWCK